MHPIIIYYQRQKKKPELSNPNCVLKRDTRVAYLEFRTQHSFSNINIFF